MTPTTKDTMNLATIATNTVMQGAVEYLHARNLTADPGTLATLCRQWAKIKLPEALADAKAALDCNMGQIAEQTFLASMRFAGIEAAKECSKAKEQAA